MPYLACRVWVFCTFQNDYVFFKKKTRKIEKCKGRKIKKDSILILTQ